MSAPTTARLCKLMEAERVSAQRFAAAAVKARESGNLELAHEHGLRALECHAKVEAFLIAVHVASGMDSWWGTAGWRNWMRDYSRKAN